VSDTIDHFLARFADDWIKAGPPTAQETIAMVQEIRRLRSEAWADARLIAAAPDLLAALKNLLEAIGGEESTDIWCRDARAAIAKAEA
jgi:hypothetical protein